MTTILLFVISTSELFAPIAIAPFSDSILIMLSEMTISLTMSSMSGPQLNILIIVRPYAISVDFKEISFPLIVTSYGDGAK